MSISRAEITHFHKKRHLKIGDKLVDLSKPSIMGIVNITPDSFYAASRHKNDHSLLFQVEKMIHQGADILDIGAYSTRPGAQTVTLKEEKARILPVLKTIRKHFPDALISLDTFRSSVAKIGIEEGANIINDIGGGQLDPKMFEVVGKENVAYILMHGASSIKTMHKVNESEHLFRDIAYFFSKQSKKLNELGQTEIILDPGFGFGKNLEQNFSLIDQLDMFKLLEHPVLMGISRKSMIYKTLGITSEQALNGSTFLHTIGLMKGVSFFRVHDVHEMKQLIQLMNV